MGYLYWFVFLFIRVLESLFYFFVVLRVILRGIEIYGYRSLVGYLLVFYIDVF